MSDLILPEIDISIDHADWTSHGDMKRLVERAVEAACAQTRPDLRPGAELSVVLGDDAQVRSLNLAWRGKDAPTNVLSFPGADEHAPPYGPLLGDIVLAYETVAREAMTLEICFSDHLTHLVVHGFLHLFGYDHQMEMEAEDMEATERRILAGLGIADPYAEPLLVAAQMENKASG